MKDLDLLKTKGVPAEWAKVLADVAAKNYVEKTYEVKVRLKLISYESDGINTIKKILSEIHDQGEGQESQGSEGKGRKGRRRHGQKNQAKQWFRRVQDS